MPGDASHDPRVSLVREKYFSVRPKPLEQWIWSQKLPASVERVFWLHWQEGYQRGDWCSEIPLRRVARECHLDVSTVTRAYQVLTRLGCLRRADPGRDPRNPFSQATAITEVRVPRELLTQLNRYPNRTARSDRAAVVEPPAETEAPATEHKAEAPPADPFNGCSGRERVRALNQLTADMSAAERHDFQEALRLRKTYISFGPDTLLTAEARATVLQLLARIAAQPPAPIETTRSLALENRGPRGPAPIRHLTMIEVAQIRQAIQRVTTADCAGELTRQVLWSMQQGALRRFTQAHAMHIALKKIRQGQWTRPHRMPPNWAQSLMAAGPGMCTAA